MYHWYFYEYLGMKLARLAEKEAYRKFESGEAPSRATGMIDGEQTAGYGETPNGYFEFPLQVDKDTQEILV